MAYLKRLILFLVTFHCKFVQATVEFKGCDILAQAFATLALNEAIKVATVASNALKSDPSLSNPVNRAALLPLFNQNDIGRITHIYDYISNIKTNTLRVTFFCSEDHVTLTPENSPTAVWQDTAFIVTATGRQVSLGIPQDPTLMIQVPRPKPGAKGSYSILGFDSGPLNADFSDQAHIYLSSKRFGQSDPNFDQRLLSLIVTSGLDPKYNNLGAIKPLTSTVFHELAHIAGGLVSPTSGVKIIRDKSPSGGSVYGWILCEQAKAANNPLFPPVNIADSYVMLAQALFLQIKGNPTYWSTGVVDPTTLRPIDLPAPPSKRNLADSSDSWGNEGKENLLEEEGKVVTRYVKKVWVA